MVDKHSYHRELYIGALNLSPWFYECKRIRGGLSVVLKNAPQRIIEELYVGNRHKRLGQPVATIFMVWRSHTLAVDCESLYLASAGDKKICQYYYQLEGRFTTQTFHIHFQ